VDDFEQRFGGVSRLVGATGVARLRQAHVCVIGIGGVGSWTVEALARSGVGALTLVDLDDVCVTNVNRQVPAVEGEFGRPKVEVMARRVSAINPACRVEARPIFFTEETATDLLSPRYDHVVDAIDSPSKKARLIAGCRERGIPVVTVGGAGGRLDPAAVRVADLAHSSHDGLLMQVRRLLRRHHGFPRGDEPFGVACVFSGESRRFPWSDGTVCDEREPGSDPRLSCDSGYGTAAFVTGVFGFAAAGCVVRRLIS
jgi:tRNA A37 threonylcarbamoyladenosine dehydratase